MKSNLILGGLILAAIPSFGAAIYTSTPYYPVFSAPSDSIFAGLTVQLRRPNMAAECTAWQPTCVEVDNGEVVISGWPPLLNFRDPVRQIIQRVVITHDRLLDSGDVLADRVMLDIGWLRTYDDLQKLELMPARGWMSVFLEAPNLYRVEGQLTVYPVWSERGHLVIYDPVTLYTTPEPGVAWLLGTGLVGIALLRWRRD